MVLDCAAHQRQKLFATSILSSLRRIMRIGDPLSTAPGSQVVDYFSYSPVDEPQSQYLSAWRGGSAILVLIGHGFDIFYADPHPIWGIIATCSVLIFFGLSGFFIHKALAKSMAKEQILGFVVGRVNRIVPPLAFAMILTISLWAAAPAAFLSGGYGFVTPTARIEFSLDGLLPSAMFLNGFAGPTLSANGPLWSLSYEVWYYIAACLFGVSVLRRRKWPILIMVAMLLALTATSPKFAIFGTIWLLGFGLSALHGLNRIPKITASPFLVVAAISVLIAAVAPFRGAQLLANLTVGLWFVLHMARVLNGNAPLKVGWFEGTSRFAYALYVIHFPLMLFIYGATGERSWIMVPALLAVFTAVALVGPRLENFRLLSHPNSLSDRSADRHDVRR